MSVRVDNSLDVFHNCKIFSCHWEHKRKSWNKNARWRYLGTSDIWNKTKQNKFYLGMIYRISRYFHKQIKRDLWLHVHSHEACSFTYKYMRLTSIKTASWYIDNDLRLTHICAKKNFTPPENKTAYVQVFLWFPYR